MIGAISQAKVAAKLIYDFIDTKPKVDINQNGIKFDPVKYNG